MLPAFFRPACLLLHLYMSTSVSTLQLRSNSRPIIHLRTATHQHACHAPATSEVSCALCYTGTEPPRVGNRIAQPAHVRNNTPMPDLRHTSAYTGLVHADHHPVLLWDSPAHCCNAVLLHPRHRNHMYGLLRPCPCCSWLLMVFVL